MPGRRASILGQAVPDLLAGSWRDFRWEAEREPRR
jgi:hypothetical protein